MRRQLASLSFWLAGASALSAIAVGAPAAAQVSPAPRRYDIPAQPLGSALSTWAEQSGVEVIFTPEAVHGKRSRRLSGTMAPEAALSALLRGSGLSSRRGSGSTIIVGNASAPAAGEVAASADLASSDGDAGDSQDIIVTAQRREERLLDVAAPVHVLRAQTLTENNLTRLEDYYTSVPGLNFTISGNGSEPLIAIRGLLTNEIGNPTVAIVVDEVAYSRSLSFNFAPTVPDIDPGELERIEILRGPQGALYGASGLGGVIKYVTRDPSTSEFSGRVQLGFSSVRFGELGYNARASVNVPLSENVALRASGFAVRDPGYVDNLETGNDDSNRRVSLGGTASLLLRPSDNFSVRLTAVLQNSDRDGRQESDTAIAQPFAVREMAGTGQYERRTRIYSGTMRADLGGFDIVSVTAYSEDRVRNVLDFISLYGLAAPRFPGTSRVSGETDLSGDKFSQEVRISRTFADMVDASIGGLYTRETFRGRVNIFANRADGTIGGLLIQNNVVAPSFYEERAIFANAKLRFSDRFDVLLGGRLAFNEQAFTRSSVTLGANPLNATPNFNPPTNRSEETAFTYLIAPSFHITPNLMAYGRLASGYRPGGPNFECGTLPELPCEFSSDTTTNYELGLRGDLIDGLLSIDASLYYIDWKDIQVGNLTVPGGPSNIRFTGNASSAKSEGAEVSLELRPFRGMSLSGWIAYNNAVLTAPLPQFFGPPLPAGGPLPFTSPWSGRIAVRQDFPLPSLGVGVLHIGGDISFVEDRASVPGGDRILPGYTQINLQAGLRARGWSINAFINNASDERGLIDRGNFATRRIYIQPRTIGLNVAREF
jgi:iron complex outermembrane receptor protein